MNWATRALAAWRATDRRVVDAGAAVVCVLLVWLGIAGKEVLPGQHPTTALTYLLALLVAAPVAIHRDHPLVAAVVSNAGLLVFAAQQYAAFPGVPSFILVFLVALHFGRRVAASVFALTAVCFAVSIPLQPAGVVGPSDAIAIALSLAVAWLLGENQRARRARWQALEERARRSEAEREQQARQAVAAERLRIARELHDIVAHAMSVIAVQSGMGRHVIDSRPDEARKALASIESTSRSALVEMRRLLGVLRQGDEPQGTLAPVPGLADVPELVRQMTASGLQVELRLEGEAVQVPPGVDLSAYRVVQEGLTNVLRHGGSRVVVAVRYFATGVAVDVTDDGPAVGATPWPARSTTSRPKPLIEAGLSGGGHGLIGVRERVGVFHGQFSAGPVPGGGFRLSATLPFEDPPGGTR